MKFVLAFAVLVLAMCAGAQTAKVVQLKPEDAARAKALYAEKTRIEQEIADFRQHINDDYPEVGVTVPCSASVCMGAGCVPPPPPKVSCHRALDGDWANGFDFSSDFRFVVPSRPAKPSTPAYGCLTPAWTNTNATEIR
jgi:hypothetical protein